MNYPLFNPFHLGDCLYNLQFIRRWLFRDAKVSVDFYSNESAFELGQFIEPTLRPRIKFRALTELADPEEEAINAWIGRDSRSFIDALPTPWLWDELQFGFAKYLSSIINIAPLYSSKQEVLFDSPQLNQAPKIEGNIDYLIINAAPRSGQFNFNAIELKNLGLQLHREGKRVITTEKIHPDVTATRELGLSVLEIAHLATHTHTVIGVLTGPLHACIHQWSLQRVKRWMVLSTGESLNWNASFQQFSSVNQLLPHL